MATMPLTDGVELDSDDDAEATGRRLEAWERAYANAKSWEALEEDESGRLRGLDPTVNQRAKRCAPFLCLGLLRRTQAAADAPRSRARKRLLDEAASARIRRGMIRYCVVVLDLSNAVNEASPQSRTTRNA